MFILIIVPATNVQLYGGTVIADINYQAGVIPALKIAVLAQVTMLAGAIGARTLRPVRGFDRIAINLSAARLDKAAIIAVTVTASGVIGFIVIGGQILATSSSTLGPPDTERSGTTCGPTWAS